MVSALPSKKIFFLIIACLVGVGAISFAVFASKTGQNAPGNQASLSDTTSQNSQGMELVAKTLQEASTQDTDADGLFNWEESLWGTDQNNPDTDADKTKDGDEIEQNRDPLKAGPDDKLTALNASTRVASSQSSSGDGTLNVAAGSGPRLETSKTATISRDLFAAYAEAKRSGITLDEETQSKIIGEVFAGKSISIPLKTYTQNEIVVSADSDLKKYGNALGTAFYAGRTQDTVSEIEIVREALEKEDSATMVRLDPIITGYTAILGKLALVSVPRNSVASHLTLMNSLSRLVSDVKGLRLIFDDPIVGIGSVGNYFQDLESFQNAIKQIESMLVQNGIAFTNTEPGYVFTNIQ